MNVKRIQGMLFWQKKKKKNQSPEAFTVFMWTFLEGTFFFFFSNQPQRSKTEKNKVSSFHQSKNINSVTMCIIMTL